MIQHGALPAFPRMSQEDAADRVKLLSALPLTAVEAASTVDVASATYYQTAADRVGSDELLVIQQQVRSLAIQHGYPIRQARGRSLTFDQELAGLLGTALRILPADAADEGVWSFLTLNVNPEVALWRFPNNVDSDGSVRENYERLVGKPRNVFRRSWWRWYMLGAALSSRLLEDESVGIMERPSIGGSARLARGVATTHLRYVDQGGVRSRQDLLREAIKRLRRRMGQISVHALDSNQLTVVIEEAFSSARDELAMSREAGVPLFSEIQTFRELTADLWPLIEPNVVEVDWSTVAKLLAQVDQYGIELAGNEVAQILVADLNRLIAGWDSYSSESRAVVHGALAYFLDLNDDIPDHLPTGLDDDDEVVGAAFASLNLIRRE